MRRQDAMWRHTENHASRHWRHTFPHCFKLGFLLQILAMIQENIIRSSAAFYGYILSFCNCFLFWSFQLVIYLFFIIYFHSTSHETFFQWLQPFTVVMYVLSTEIKLRILMELFYWHYCKGNLWLNRMFSASHGAASTCDL
jgi:hypothetical protein